MELNTSPSGLEVLGIVSAVVAIVAAFLPWITAGADLGPVEVSGSVAGVDQNVGVLTLIVAVLTVLVVLLAGFEVEGALATAVLGIVVLGAGVFQLADLPGFASAGVGLYLTIVSGLGIAAAGLLGYQGRSGSDSALG